MDDRQKYLVTSANGKETGEQVVFMSCRTKSDTKCWGCDDTIEVGDMYFWLMESWHVCNTCVNAEPITGIEL